MFTAKPQKNRTAATEYFDEHLSQNDYYSQGQTQAGYWVGVGAERLGLMPGEVVGREAFLRLCDNQHPETGQKLTQVHFTDRRVFFDFTCSAPKSVSILAVTMNDSRIVEAHREAAAVAIRELEAFAGTRVRKSGAMEDRATGNLVAAAFLHTSSRALDPQLHTHFTVFNATFDPVENRWKALQSSGMFGAIHYGTAVYRNELASRLHGLGYSTRVTAHGFEVEGVEQKLIERFSKRSQQRNAAVAREEKRLGRKLSNDEISHVVHQSRPRKVKDATEGEVRARQLDEIGFFEKRALRAVVAQAKGERKDFQETVHLGQATGYAVEHVFARKSVAPEHELLEAALIKGCGQVDLPELKAAVRSDRELVRVGREVSTRKILGEELRLIRFVNDGLGTVAPLVPRYTAPDALGADRRAALGHVLSSSDRVTGFRGLAGTGKTTTLKEFGRVVAAVGGEAVFLAPTAGAVDVLRKDGFKEAATLAKFLADPQVQARVSGRSPVIVLDEAGAVGTSDMLRLLEIAQARGARVVLSGDTGQHASVAQGDALRLIEEHSGYRFAVLGEIRRQKPAVFRQAVKLAAGQDAAGAFRLLQKDGAVVEVLADDGALHAQAAAAYLKAVDAGQSALLVSPTWGEIEAVTGCVRDQLKQRGTVMGREETVAVFDSLGWTDAQKRQIERYEPGLQLRFAKRTAQFKPGELATVEAMRGRTLVLRSPDGETAVMQPARAPAAFEVGQKRELPVASGDWLLLQANGHGFTNGERVQVKALGKGGIALADGRTLPASYRSFTHGYAVTSHAAQGKTVDVALFVASSRSFAAVSRESFYVGISRGREQVRIFTDDAATLERRVEETHTRKAALELQGLREEMARHGLLRLREEEEKRLKEERQRAAAADEAERRERDMRSVRTLRPVRALRVLRGQRLAAPVLTLQRWAQEFRRWIGARAAMQVEAPALSWERRFHLNQKQQETPRQSRGIRI
jgi:conjugative relaxase-like TrwC/TraI family protein